MNPMNVQSIIGSYSCDFFVNSYDLLYSSREFTIEGIDDCNFQLQVCGKHSPYCLQISVKKSNKEKVSAKITVSFRQMVITRTVDDWVDTYLLTTEPLETFIKSIKINCEIIWYGTKKNSSSIQAPLILSPDLKNFHLNSSLSDIRLSISGEELPAHKVILAAYSPVFLSMFETDMREKTDNRIVIEGIELNVMKIVLSILYTGYEKVLDEVEMAKKVLVVAERYDMKSLKSLCELKLSQKLEVSNVMNILDEADNCNAQTLHAECVNFIVQNKRQMAKSEDWGAFCHHQPRTICSLLSTFTTTL